MPPNKYDSLMKSVLLFSFILVVSSSLFSCRNDQEDFGQMKGINYFSRNDAFSSQEISFENSAGIANDTLKKSAILSIEPNTFVNEDGSSFSGKVVMHVTSEYVRGYMALYSTPSTNIDKPLISDGGIYTVATDLYGHNLKIATGKNFTISIPGGNTPNQNKLFYADDNVKDPSPANTSLFEWNEASSDIVENYFDSNSNKYFYTLKPTQLGWASCARSYALINPVGIKVRVLGINPLYSNNTAVYVIPKTTKNVIRLWNYDKTSNTFSMDKPLLESGTDVFVIVISSTRKFKIYYVKDECVVDGSTFKVVTAVETSLNSIATNLYYL